MIGYGSDVWVLTSDTYFNALVNGHDVDKVIGMSSGDLIRAEVEEVNTGTYTGTMVVVKDKQGKALFSAAAQQRFFWMSKSLKPEIGTALDFEKAVNRDGKAYLFTAFSENKHYAVYPEDIHLEQGTDAPVWGVRTNTGNIVIRSESEALILSDLG